MPTDIGRRAAIERIFREEYGRAVAVLVRAYGDIDLAEEAVQEAFVTAAARWPIDGLPPTPGGWIITTARNRAIDRLRREATRGTTGLGRSHCTPPTTTRTKRGQCTDDRLRLIFTCCHPALAATRRWRSRCASSAG